MQKLNLKEVVMSKAARCRDPKQRRVAALTQTNTNVYCLLDEEYYFKLRGPSPSMKVARVQRQYKRRCRHCSTFTFVERRPGQLIYTCKKCKCNGLDYVNNQKRHITFAKVFKEIKGYLPVLPNTEVITLAGTAMEIDKQRLLEYVPHAAAINTYEYCGSHTSHYLKLKDFVELNNIVSGGNKTYKLFNKNVFEAVHANLTLANLDLQVSTTHNLLKQVEGFIANNTTIGVPLALILNTTTRAQVNAEEQRSLWYAFINGLDRMKYKRVLFESQKYPANNTGAMQIHSAIIRRVI
jgi:hypothetical protein